MRAVVRSFVAVGLLGAVVLAVPVSPVGADRPKPPVPELDWGSCGDDFPIAECAVATVPLDYDNPRAGTTEIALARIPASDPANRIGSVFINPGGPGGSGVGLTLFGFGEFLAANLDGRFDVVGFDPRGVGFSDPLHCFDSEDELFEFFDAQGVVFPYEHEQYRPFFDVTRGLGPECRDDDRRIADHMSTADVARDLDLLRQAVGDRKLTYLGFSYGSYLGNTYANLFPQNVRALVIDGVLDPRLWSSGWQIKSDRVATQEEFDEFLRLCDEAGPECAFSAPEGSAARWEALADSLRDEPLVFPDGFVYTYDFLIGDATSAMYSPESWGGPEGAGAFLDFLADAVLGDQAAAASASAVRSALVAKLTPPGFEADYDNGFDAYYGNQCADTEYPSAFLSWRLIDAYAGDRIPLRSLLVVVQRRMRRLAGQPRPLHRAVDGADGGAGPRRRQLLRRRDRLRRRPGQRRTAAQQPAARLRRVGPHRLRPQRVRHRAHRCLPPRRHAAATRHGVPGEPQPVRHVRRPHDRRRGAAGRTADLPADEELTSFSARRGR